MRILWIFVISTLLTCSTLTKAENKTLTLGIFPYVSSSKLITHNKNLQKHINNTSQYRASLVSANDVLTYINKLTKYNYDLIFCAPHLARFVEKKYAYQRIAMTTHHIRGVYLARKDTSIYSAADLKGKKLSMTPATSILHQIVLKQLKKHDIIPGYNIELKTAKTHNNAIYDVLNNDSDAAVTGMNLWTNLPLDSKKKLRQFTKTDAVSGFIVLAKPDIDKASIKNIQKLFLSFNKTPAGKAYIFKGFRLITDQDMEALDSYASVFE